MIYDKYLTKDRVIPSKRTGRPMMSTRHLDSFGKGDCSIDCIYITSPRLMIDKAHNHEFAQYLCFFSANAEDASDFDARIELSLGEEGEKHIISSPTIAYIAEDSFTALSTSQKSGSPSSSSISPCRVNTPGWESPRAPKQGA